MSDLKNKTKNQLKLEFVKSAVMLLLAFILLISVAFAWFRGGGDSEQEVVTLSVSLTSPEQSDVELGSDVVRERSIVLPCATKLGDTSIDLDDFKSAVAVDIYTIAAASDVEVEVIVEPVEDEEGKEMPIPHYYVCSDYTADMTNEALAEIAYNNHYAVNNPNDKSTTFVMPKDVDKKVAIVYWSDYNNEFESGVNGNTGKYVYKANVHFKSEIEETNEETT